MDLRMQGHAVRRRNNYSASTVHAAEIGSKKTDFDFAKGKPSRLPEEYGTEVGLTLGLEANQLPRQDPLNRIRRHG